MACTPPRPILMIENSPFSSPSRPRAPPPLPHPHAMHPDSSPPAQALIVVSPAALAAREAATIHAYLDASTAESTRRAYASDLAHFATWCAVHQLPSLPAAPATVARYLAALAQADYAMATLERRLAAISQAHQARDLDTPTRALAVRKVFAGIRRTHGSAQQGKAPLLPADLQLLISQLDASPRGLRDRALLLVGFAGAFRRSELVALACADVARRREGLVLTVRRSKTDQEGEGMQKAIPRGAKGTCPVRALDAWLAAGGITEGPIFRPIDRHGRIKPTALAGIEVARLIKRLAAAAGLDPDVYGGHSLRAGLVTAAAQAGANERDIMRQTGHRSERTLRKYIREANLFTANAADGLL